MRRSCWQEKRQNQFPDNPFWGVPPRNIRGDSQGSNALTTLWIFDGIKRKGCAPFVAGRKSSTARPTDQVRIYLLLITRGQSNHHPESGRPARASRCPALTIVKLAIGALIGTS